MVFPDFPTLKKAVGTYNMLHGRDYITNHKKRANWKVSCTHYISTPSCPWTLSAKKLHGASTEWQVTKYTQPHECTVQFNQRPADKLCTSSLICDLIFPKITADPQYKIKHIQVDVRQRFGVDISYRKAWYARHKCIEMQYGNYQQSYNELPQFCRQLQLSNPGTIVEIMTTHNAERGTGYKGHLLLACGYTANKEIYPLAYSIVDSENNASWTWFLRLLAENVFPHHNSMCIVSDRHAGIDAAFNSVEQLKGGRVKRRFCLRHIRSNVMSRVTRNRRLRKLVWEAGTAVTRDQFLQHMHAIQIKWPAAYAYLADIDFDKWTLSHDDGHRYGIMTTNPSESLNNSLKCCRMLPVTAIVRMTFHKLRTMFADRRTAGEGM
ncbi:PREDICTED: uncharacterized protein LOC109193437 isoform X2 [Ipomoea nil]|uniref:uncharacterized protein LOC109193437 isoform X2 n=1 Tax=Ipomoea nil TaxID=35883 RepID=UPI000900ED18|nr:PREDICTED: uncharacterized protein LOC109193437 isoform X2 [Ipomoea nil]